MSEQPAASREQARALAAIAGLDLSPDRLTELTRALAEHRERTAKLRAVAPLDQEPPIAPATAEADR